MKKIFVVVVLVIFGFSAVHLAVAKNKGPKLNDQGVPIVAKYVCSDLCGPDETIYMYEGVADAGRCQQIGGEMYSHQGWETIVVCKVMHPKRCKEQDGRMGEFHFPFQPKNYTHLGCTADMTPDDCREVLRQVYASKPTANKYFMNNTGCMTH